jgi:hypothetical protein
MHESGLSATAIGRRFGTTKNAIVGLLHRMRVPARPNPVNGAGWTPDEDEQLRAMAPTMTNREISALIPGRTKGAVKARRIKLGLPRCDPKRGAEITANIRRSKALLKAEAMPKPAPKAKVLRPIFITAKPGPPSRSFPVLPPSRSALQASVGSALSCQWIEGDPRVPGWRFCDAPRAEVGPYCLEHRAICFLSAKEPAAKAA